MPVTRDSNLVTALSDLADIRLGVAFRSRLKHDPKGAIAILQMKDISESTGLSYAGATHAALPDVKRELLVRQGDLVFRSRGRSIGAALVGADAPPAILAAPLLLIRPLHILPEYLWWFLNSGHAQAQLAALTVGTWGQTISMESLRGLSVLIPPEETQRKVAELAQLIRHEEELVSTITRRRKQLVNRILMDFARQGANGVNR